MSSLVLVDSSYRLNVIQHRSALKYSPGTGDSMVHSLSLSQECHLPLQSSGCFISLICKHFYSAILRLLVASYLYRRYMSEVSHQQLERLKLLLEQQTSVPPCAGTAC